MAQKSGFFNALLDAGVYDRTYNADDYCDNLAVIISNGVLRSANDDLKVTASGLNLSVNQGRAWIKGHYFNNTSSYSLPAVTLPTGASRIDRVVLRFDNTIENRNISIQYLTGTAATSPVAPDLTRTDDVYELCLAEITVAAGASNVSVNDTRSDADLCGWVYSVTGDGSFFTSLDNTFNDWFEDAKNTLASVTLFKRYKWETTVEHTTDTISFSISQYDPDTCFIEVYVNGMLADNYTQSENVLTFDDDLNAGAEVIVYCFKSIDGTGIMTVADEITELQNQYAALSGISNFTYKATGTDDNISISEIAQAFYSGSYDPEDVTTAANAFLTALGGNTWLSGLDDNAQITISVVGKLGVTAAAYGTGTSGNRYRYFNIGQLATNSKRVILDFAKADAINIECPASKYSIIFYGSDLEIKNASVGVTSAGSASHVQMIAESNQGRVFIDNCKFEMNITGDGQIAKSGTFTNCYCKVASSGGHALLFVPDSTDLIRIIGGTFYAYAATSGKTAAVFYTYSTGTNAVIIAQNINCPTVALEGFWQQYLSVAYAGKTYIDFVCSTMNSTGNYNTITNQIWLSKA